jgi:hypothetical protein
MRSLSRTVLTAVFAALALCALASAQDNPYGHARDLIARVQHDLDYAQQMAPVAGPQKERYETAHRRLSQFDDALSHGEYDGGKAGDAIGAVKSVFKNNVLSPHSRDQIRDDLDALNAMRNAKGKI